MNLEQLLKEVEKQSPAAWVYLPKNRQWSLDSDSAVLESEEVPPELEDDPEAGIPEFARKNNLMQVLPVTVVQDVVRNAKAQKPDVTTAQLFDCFIHYFEHDAFLKL